MTPEEWNHVLDYFADANIYQAWGYTAARWGKSRLSHFIMEDQDGIKAAALVRNLSVPGIKAGLAYVSMGPLWRKKGRSPKPSVLQAALISMRQELAEKHGLQLRVRPKVFTSQVNHDFIDTIGFAHRPHVRPYESLMIDLGLSEDKLMASFHGKWRNALKKGLKTDCEVVIGRDVKSFDYFLNLQQEMVQRKQFKERMDLQALHKAQEEETDANKLIFFLALHEGQAVAAIGLSWLGDTAVYLLGASNSQGRRLNASYVLQWHVLQKLKEWGCTWYDLGGINTHGKSGILQFKQRLAGKNGTQIQLIGEIETQGSTLSRSLTWGLDQVLKVRGIF